MTFSNPSVNKLLSEMKKRLSEKRFLHTLGVLKAAQKLSVLCLPDRITDISVAAILHDVAKEYELNTQLELIRRHSIPFTDEDLKSPAVLHSYAGVGVIIEDFPEFACTDVKSSVYNHTVGSPFMSVFDEIIFLADYIEETRSYNSCIALREKTFSSMKDGDYLNNVKLLHTFCVEAIKNTYDSLSERGKFVNPKMLLTLNALKDKI